MDKATLTEPFVPGNDNAHYDAEGTYYDVQPGTFLLFFPENVHRAGIRSGSVLTDKKLVIKIRYTPVALPTVTLDYYFNNEWHKAQGDSVRYHYTWEDQANSGFSKLGGLFKDQGFALASLTTAPTADNLGRASVKSESELAEFASAALAKLKKLPDKVRAFFGDPALRYIRLSITRVQEPTFSLDHTHCGEKRACAECRR